MKFIIQEKNSSLIEGDSLLVLREINDNVVDSLVTDPPAGISFMGKDWDSNKGGRDEWIAWMSEVMRECMRVMKPGAHGLVWAIPRTSHWTATALENAGFEVRDVITHLFGSGFPKSHNIEKASGNSRWAGWGTALKPASEHWILIRKPISEKTVAANVLKWGCGGLNIDASRIGTGDDRIQGGIRKVPSYKCEAPQIARPTGGRFPANLALSHSDHCTEDQCDIECAIKMLDEQSGTLKSGSIAAHHIRTTSKTKNAYGERMAPAEIRSGDSGGASRFFYCAKASKSDKGSSNVHPTVKSTKLMSYLIRMVTPPNGTVLDPFTGSGSTGVAALKEGFKFIGIERELEYITIAENRIKNVG